MATADREEHRRNQVKKRQKAAKLRELGYDRKKYGGSEERALHMAEQTEKRDWRKRFNESGFKSTGNADRDEHRMQQWKQKEEQKDLKKYVLDKAGWTDKDLGTSTERRAKKYRPGEVFKGVEHRIEGMPEYESAETVTTRRTLTNMGSETKEERNVKKDAGVAAKFAEFQKKMAARKQVKSLDTEDIDKAKLERKAAVERKRKKGRSTTMLSTTSGLSAQPAGL